MHTFPKTVDVAVIGAGPVGCVTALFFARKGADVALLEARPEAALTRLAGEWLHPPAVRILRDLDVLSVFTESQHRLGQGFAFFPEDGSKPVLLSYPGGSSALCCEHGLLVTALREAARAQPRLRWLAPAQFRSIYGQRLRIESQSALHELKARWIVGADGRSSQVRAALAPGREPRAGSLMAGVLLEGVELPHEGYGHVLLGGPGPVLMFRIAPRRVRICLDVPHGKRAPRAPEALWEAYGPVLPPALRDAFREALRSHPVAWNVNRLLARLHPDHPGVALAGDAVGHFHPLTAAGMTVGFLDAECLAESESLVHYREERLRGAYAAEALAHVLYEVLQRQDTSAAALRQGIYRLWRGHQDERHCTMRLLSGEESDPKVFSRTFFKVLDLATRQTILEHASWRHWHELLQTLGSLGRWLKWPLSSVFYRAA